MVYVSLDSMTYYDIPSPEDSLSTSHRAANHSLIDIFSRVMYPKDRGILFKRIIVQTNSNKFKLPIILYNYTKLCKFKNKCE